MSKYYKQSVPQTLTGLAFGIIALITINTWLPLAVNLYMNVATALIGLLPW